MGRYGGEIAVVGVKTRARAALTMAAKTSSSSSPAKKIKKTSKTPSYSASNCNYQLRSSSRRRNSSLPENFATQRDSTAAAAVAVVTVAVMEEETEIANCSSSEVITTTINSDFPPSCCSSNENKEDNENDRLSFSNDVVMDRCIGDPEVENNGESSSRCADCHTQTEEKEEKTSLREEEEEAMKSNDEDYNSPTKSTVQIKRMPSDSEIEEFFAVAEKDIQKRFIDKYNFDIVKDIPLEGRYDWVQIKP